MYNSAMRQADHYVSICDVGKETHNLILLESPPPYRQNLQIDVGTLTGLLGMAGAEEDQLKLSFERQQNVVRAAPTHAGRLAATTKETRFKEEKDQNHKLIVYDSRKQELGLNISYPDDEVKTPIATARNLSRRLTGALSMVPAEKYFTNFLEDLRGEPVSGRAAELVLHTGRIIATALGFPIAYGILGIGNNAPHLWQTLGILAGGNLMEGTLTLYSALRLINGEVTDEKKAPFAKTIAENPMRAVYPVSLVHECLLPTARILAHNSVTSTPLLKSNEE